MNLALRFDAWPRLAAVLVLCLAALAARAAGGPEGWAESREGELTVFVPPGETSATAALVRLPDQPVRAGVATQLRQWLDARAAAAGGRAISTEPLRQSASARGDWAAWAGRIEGGPVVRWCLLLLRHEGPRAVGVLLETADAARLGRYTRAAALYFDQAAAADGPPAGAAPARAAPGTLVGVWTNLPLPADAARPTRAQLLAAAGTGLWLDLRADGSLRYASKAPRYATTGGLGTIGGAAPLVTGADRLDGRYQEGRWAVEGDELVLQFERGRHLDAIDRPDADQPLYRGGGRRYPLQWTPDGQLRLAVTPGQWMDPLRRLAPP